MQAALENFALMQHPRKLAILGEMRELGEFSAEAHRTVLHKLAETGCAEAWLVGENYAQAARSIEAEAPEALPVLRLFPDAEAVKAELAAHPLRGALILIKGSNGTRLFTLPPLL